MFYSFPRASILILARSFVPNYVGCAAVRATYFAHSPSSISPVKYFLQDGFPGKTPWPVLFLAFHKRRIFRNRVFYTQRLASKCGCWVLRLTVINWRCFARCVWNALNAENTIHSMRCGSVWLRKSPWLNQSIDLTAIIFLKHKKRDIFEA